MTFGNRLGKRVFPEQGSVPAALSRIGIKEPGMMGVMEPVLEG